MEIRDHKVDLDCSFDSFCDEITDECSPNSIKDYTTFCSQDGNVLVSNKGKIKDIYSFKFELLECFRKHELVNSVCTPIRDQSLFINNTSRPKCKVKLQSLKTPLSNVKFARSSLVRKPNRILINKEKDHQCSNNEKIIFKAPSQSKKSFALESISSFMRNSRSASRKVSSSKILNLLQKSIYCDEIC